MSAKINIWLNTVLIAMAAYSHHYYPTHYWCIIQWGWDSQWSLVRLMLTAKGTAAVALPVTVMAQAAVNWKHSSAATMGTPVWKIEELSYQIVFFPWCCHWNGLLKTCLKPQITTNRLSSYWLHNQTVSSLTSSYYLYLAWLTIASPSG